MKHSFPAILILAATAAAPAAADQFDESVLLRHKDWTVSHIHDSSDGQQWCDATTQSGQTAMSLLAFDTGEFAFVLHDPRWRVPEGSERYMVVDIDYERFDGWADVVGSNLLGLTLTGETGVDFLVHLKLGSAVAVYNEDMRRIATFSLRGSSAAVAKLAECWSRIELPSPSDPFLGTGASSPDPFL